MATKKKAVKKAATAAPKKETTPTGRGLDFPGMPKPGARLTRVYKEKTYTVTVNKSGFTYNGKAYDSLTAIAREITGIQCLSGPGFFGLKPKKAK